jgi:hypothetical protein
MTTGTAVIDPDLYQAVSPAVEIDLKSYKVSFYLGSIYVTTVVVRAKNALEAGQNAKPDSNIQGLTIESIDRIWPKAKRF